VFSNGTRLATVSRRSAPANNATPRERGCAAWPTSALAWASIQSRAAARASSRAPGCTELLFQEQSGPLALVLVHPVRVQVHARHGPGGVLPPRQTHNLLGQPHGCPPGARPSHPFGPYCKAHAITTDEPDARMRAVFGVPRLPPPRRCPGWGSGAAPAHECRRRLPVGRARPGGR
jgi:hypothetical protein